MEKEEKWYKIYVPIEKKYEHSVRMAAARRNKGTAVYLAKLIQEIIEKNELEHYLKSEIVPELWAS